MKRKEETEDERERWKEKTKAAQRGERYREGRWREEGHLQQQYHKRQHSKQTVLFLLSLLHQKMNPFPVGRYCDRHEEGVRVCVEQ